MLVAYAPCGCLATALLADDDPGDVEDFVEECLDLGFVACIEDRETVAASPCAEHAQGPE
jgi:hypothetical protein